MDCNLLGRDFILVIGLLPYSCHLVIPVFIFRRSSSCGDFKGKSFPLGPRHLNDEDGDWSEV